MKTLLTRKFLPLYGVLVVLVLAFASPLPSLAAATASGHWHAVAAHTSSHGQSDNHVGGAALENGNGGTHHSNCGIKGDGSHDHGKTCPNYPFPGRGH